MSVYAEVDDVFVCFQCHIAAIVQWRKVVLLELLCFFAFLLTVLSTGV